VASTTGSPTPTNSPLYRSSQSDGTNNYPAFEYDGTDARHDIVTQATPDLPSGNTTLSVFVLYYTDVLSNEILTYETDGSAILIDSNINLNSFPVTNIVGGTSLKNEWTTAGFVQRSGSTELYTNGGSIPTGSVNETGNYDAGGYIGAGLNGGDHFDGFIAEVIVSKTDESGTAYKNYHDSRIS